MIKTYKKNTQLDKRNIIELLINPEYEIIIELISTEQTKTHYTISIKIIEKIVPRGTIQNNK